MDDAVERYRDEKRRRGLPVPETKADNVTPAAPASPPDDTPSYETLAEAFEDLHGVPFSPVDQVIELIARTIGAGHEGVADEMRQQIERGAHQSCGTAIDTVLSLRHPTLSDRQRRLRIAQANPWFDRDHFENLDKVLDGAATSRLKNEARGIELGVRKLVCADVDDDAIERGIARLNDARERAGLPPVTRDNLKKRKGDS